MLKDSDIVTYFAIQMFLYSSAYQHALTHVLKDEIHFRVLDIAHRKVVSAAVELSAEIQQLKGKHKLEADKTDIPVGNIVYFEHDYFCKNVMEKESFPIAQSCKSDLIKVSDVLLTTNVNEIKSFFIEQEHCLLLSGKITNGRCHDHKPFWVLCIKLAEIVCCCVEFSKKLSL